MTSVDRVKVICKERKLAISKLEKDLGYGNGYISQLRKGIFPSDRLMEICKYLGISPEYILNGNEKSAPAATGKRAFDDLQLSADEAEFIRKFRRLDTRGKSAVLNAMEHEYAALPGNAPATRRQA